MSQIENIPVNIQQMVSELFYEHNSNITKENFANQLDRIRIFCDLALNKYNKKKQERKRVNG